MLHEGPLADVPAAELRTVRARFLAEHGWGDVDSIRGELERRDELLEQAVRDGQPIVLWFEHDLFDQVQLLQVLARLADLASAQVELVQADDYLGSLDAGALERLWETRRPVAPEVFELARAGWTAVCEGEIETFLARDTSALPHLDAALRRLLEERQPLSRTKRQLLAALADGPKRPPALFAAGQAAEEALFLGDAWCFLHLWELAEEGLVAPVSGRLPLPPPRGDYEAFTGATLELTRAGRALVRAFAG